MLIANTPQPFRAIQKQPENPPRFSGCFFSGRHNKHRPLPVRYPSVATVRQSRAPIQAIPNAQGSLKKGHK